MAKLIEFLISFVFLVGMLVLAQWIWGGPPTGPLGRFTWAAYGVGGILAFSIAGSSLAGLWHLVEWVSKRGERAREARMLSAEAHFFYVDAAGGHGPYKLGTIVLVPALAVIQVEFRVLPRVSEASLDAMRSIVNEAAERLKRDAAPETWVNALPAALAGLRQHDFELDGPKGGFYQYDPPEAPGKA